MDLSHWVFTDKFTDHQAAFLILGVDPSGNVDGLNADHIKQRIAVAYESALENLKFQFLVEPSLPDSWSDADEAKKPFDRKATLMSVKMEELSKLFADGDDWSTLMWLENQSKSIWEQYFSRDELARWIRENNLPSKYLFSSLPKSEAKRESIYPMDKPLLDKERKSLLNIIGVMLELLQTPKAGRTSDAAIIQEMIDNYPEKQGIAKRTLEEKFAAANKSLKAE